VIGNEDDDNGGISNRRLIKRRLEPFLVWNDLRVEEM
jgi:hypothetical protein